MRTREETRRLRQLQERLEKIRKLAKEIKRLTYFELLTLRFLKKHPDSTMLTFAGSTFIKSEEIERLFDTSEKRGLIAGVSTDTTGGDFEREALDKKLFSLTAYGQVVLTKTNKLLQGDPL